MKSFNQSIDTLQTAFQHIKPKHIGAVAAAGALTLSLSACTSKSYEISPENFGVMKNVAGACLVDGANVRADYPMPTAEGKPSNVELAKLIVEVNFDGVMGNGAQKKNARDVARDPSHVACFDVENGQVPFVTTKTKSGETRFWYELKVGDIDREDRLKPVVDALHANKLDKAYVASDGVTLASKLDAQLSPELPNR